MFPYYKIIRTKNSCDFRRNFLVPFLMLIVVLHLSSCVPAPIDIEIEAPSPKLVVASQIVPDSIMFVMLTRTFSALSQTANSGSSANNFIDSIVTKNALVTVSYNGQTDTLPMLIPGLYASTKVLQYNYGTYTLHAKDNLGALEISAVTTLLPAIRFDSIVPKLIKTATDTSISVDYSFTDVPGVDNYYVISYFLNKIGNGQSLDINNYFNRGSNQLNDLEILSDKTFGTTLYKSTRKLSGVRTSDTLAVVLSNISKEYYEFLSAYKKAGSWFNQLTGEPINYPTNVVNGYGFFNAHIPDSRIFYLKNY